MRKGGGIRQLNPRLDAYCHSSPALLCALTALSRPHHSSPSHLKLVPQCLVAPWQCLQPLRSCQSVHAPRPIPCIVCLPDPQLASSKAASCGLFTPVRSTLDLPALAEATCSTRWITTRPSFAVQAAASDVPLGPRSGLSGWPRVRYLLAACKDRECR
ncbi:hypothetical protein K402DRAFT_107418 [Aulographum hederae CBS 113979]|uniref:Uncharacterized protein n=1 Tax=Aulographum hederae CBS 113979 TaxID=1176131 RepID=A0A6G1GX86_9PEZI|nr:hypothetical protein K402DRAFT_107418 [Aulographum hederae CBS 113979]